MPSGELREEGMAPVPAGFVSPSGCVKHLQLRLVLLTLPSAPLCSPVPSLFKLSRSLCASRAAASPGPNAFRVFYIRTGAAAALSLPFQKPREILLPWAVLIG